MNERQQFEQAEKEIEISIENAREAVERKKSVEALFKNKHFKEIFEEGYFKDEAARLVSLLTDPEFNSDEEQKKILNDMIGISATRQFLLNIYAMGRQMENAIKRSEEQLEEMREELEASEQQGE